MVRQVYFDNAATTQVIPEVLEEILPYFSERYGNPSSIHEMGAEAAAGMRIARERVAKTLNCYPSEITFTSGGTESDNIALMGVVGKRGPIWENVTLVNDCNVGILWEC